MALLIYAGTEVEDLHDTLPEPGRPEGTEEENWTAYEQSKTKLKIHFSPKQCNDFAIFELLRMKIESSESITSYAMRLRKAVSKYDFTNWSAEKMIKSLIISNMQDDTLRLKFLQKDRTLDQILDIARKKEDAVARSKVIDRDSRQVRPQTSAIGVDTRTISLLRSAQPYPESAITVKRKDTMSASASRNKRKQESSASKQNPKLTPETTPTPTLMSMTQPRSN
jgi:hypothetical protein